MSGGTLQVGVDTVYNTPGVPSSGIASSAIGTGTLTFDGGTLQAGGSYTIANAGAVNTTGGTIDANGNSFTYSGAIGNGNGATGSLTVLDSSVAGGGTVTFSGANTYTGATIVGDGINSVTLALSGAGSIASSSSLAINNNATFDISAATPTSVTTADGQTNVTAVAIKTLQDGAGANGSSAINLGGNTLYINQQNAGTFSGIIQDGVALGGSGVGSLFKDGAGTLTLAGVNTYTGATSIYAGTLVLSGFGSISNSSTLTIYNGATFDISNASQGSQVVVNNLQDGGNATKNGSTISLGTNALYVQQQTSGVFSGQIIGGDPTNFALFKDGAGTLTLAGSNSYSGLTAIVKGTLAGGTTNAFSANSGMIVAQGGTLDLGGYSQTVASLSDATLFGFGAGMVTNNGTSAATLTISGGLTSTFAGTIQDGTTGTTGLALTGIGTTLILSGTNSYSGGTTIGSGAMLMGGANNAFSKTSATTIKTGGTVDLGGFKQTINTVNLAGGTIQNGSLTGAITSTGGTVSGIGGTATLMVSGGTTTLAGINSYTGATTVSVGTLEVTAGSALTASSSLTNKATFQVDTGASATFTGAVTNSGAITVANAATLTATAGGITNSMSGNISNFGIVNAALTNSGTVTNQTGGIWNGNVNSVAGSITNNGTWTGNVTGNPTLVQNNATWNATNVSVGNFTNNSGGTVSTSTNSTITTNALTNGGTVNAQGTLTAPTVTNTGNFNVTGALSGSVTTFNNNGGTLAVGANFTGIGTLTNSGTITVGGSTGTGSLTASTGTTNSKGGTITVSTNGTVTDTLTNSGTVNNAGTYKANVTNQSTVTIANTGAWFGNLLGNSNTTAGAINNSGAWVGDANNGGALTNSGAWTTTSAGFTNSGTLTQTGGGIFATTGGFTNTGTVNFSGGAIDGAITNNSGGVFNIDGTVTGNNTFANNANATLAIGANSFTGITTLTNAGIISIGPNGILTATSLMSTGTINASGGTIRGKVAINGGALNTTGTLTIHGSLTLASAATYMVTINGSNFSTTNVTGNATINGAKLQISASNVSLGQAYTLVTAGTANGTLSGTFGSTTVSGTNYIETTTYSGNKATATFSNPKLSPGALPPGFNSFVNTVNSAPNGSTLQNFVNIPQSSLLGAASAASGQSNTGGIPTLANMQSSFTTALLNPNIGQRSNAIGAFGPALGFAPEIPNTPEEQAAYDAVTPRAPLDALMKSLNEGYTHSAWGSVYGGYASMTGASNVGSPTAITRGGGIASGIDFRLTRDTVVGFALGGGQTGWSISNALGDGTSDIFQAGIYGSQRLGSAYVSGSLAYALDSLKTNRNVTMPSPGTLTANFIANGVTGRVEGGYRFGPPDLGVTPYLASEFSVLVSPAYGESASSGSQSLALSYQGQTTTDVRAEIGVWASKSFYLADRSTFWFGGRAGYAHDWWNNTFLSATFLSLPTSSFTMTGITPPSNIGLASLMGEIKGINGWSFGVKLDGEFASGAYSLGATGTLRYSW